MYKVEISVTGSKTDVKKKKPFNYYQINNCYSSLRKIQRLKKC